MAVNYIEELGTGIVFHGVKGIIEQSILLVYFGKRKMTLLNDI